MRDFTANITDFLCHTLEQEFEDVGFSCTKSMPSNYVGKTTM